MSLMRRLAESVRAVQSCSTSSGIGTRAAPPMAWPGACWGGLKYRSPTIGPAHAAIQVMRSACADDDVVVMALERCPRAAESCISTKSTYIVRIHNKKSPSCGWTGLDMPGPSCEGDDGRIHEARLPAYQRHVSLLTWLKQRPGIASVCLTQLA